MKIAELKPQQEKHIFQINEMLVDAFGESKPGKWLKDIEKSFESDRISIAAMDDEDNAIGWIGGISQYHGNVWELHPLVVKKDLRDKGIGSKLVKAFEVKVKERGGITIWLGSDDENDATSLAGTDLYVDMHKKIENIRNYKNHPFEFYKKLGYVIVGVMPDANGPGKPDIYMAKRVRDK